MIFFALLSGFFHPFLTGSNPFVVIIGVLILFLGLVGSILLYKTVTYERRPSMFVVLESGLISYKAGSSNHKRLVFFIAGLILIIISTLYIYQITGRI